MLQRETPAGANRPALQRIVTGGGAADRFRVAPGGLAFAAGYTQDEQQHERHGRAMSNRDQTTAELRPAHLEDWLDALPYADFLRTAQMLEQALKQTNQEQGLKPGLRAELMALYWRPYQYLVNALAKGANQSLLRSVDALQARNEALKRVALELAFGTRIAVQEPGPKRALFGPQQRSPAAGLVAMARLLSHTLMLAFNGYQPQPKTVWRELHEVYLQAEAQGLLTEAHAEPAQDPPRSDSVLGVFVETAVTALADPYHLPPGAVWEIYEQVREWVADVRIGPYRPVKNPAGYFVIDLRGNGLPVAYAKFDPARATDGHRLLDCAPLQRLVQAHLEKVVAGTPSPGLHLARPHARMLLEFLQRSWGLPPKRYFPRQQKQGAVTLTCGYNATWFYTHGRQEFTLDREPDDDYASEDVANLYFTERWSFVDEGPGGFAVYTSEKPRSLVRVGELVGVQDGAGGWTIGAIRWLMVQRDLAHKIGIQIVSRDADPVAVRALSGADAETRFRRAFMLTDPAATNGFTLVTPRGLYLDRRPVEVMIDNNRLQLTAGTLRESTIAFDHFSCRR